MMLTQFVAKGKDSAGRQGARPEMAERPTFENEALLADRHFHAPFQDQYEIVGSFSLFDEVRNGTAEGGNKRGNGSKKNKNGLFRWKIGKLEKEVVVEICIGILLADR
jgi:hypothetical protein